VALLRAAGGQSAVTHEANDIHTALGMVASHLGFSLVGRSVSRGSRQDVSFVPVADLKAKAAVFAVTKDGETSKLVSSFVDTLVATAVGNPGTSNIARRAAGRR
jgi:DNA-binding transcriptional LysR family regulator